MIRPSNAAAGAKEEFVFVGRLDNLAMTYCSLTALMDTYPTEESLAEEAAVKAVALFDNEEVGSDSAAGTGCAPRRSRNTLAF